MILFVPSISTNPIELSQEQVRHLKAKRILFDKQEVFLSDGKTHAQGYLETLKKGTFVHCVSQTALQPRSNLLSLYVGVIKPDRMSWLIEKATELGCDQIIPIWTERAQRSHWSDKTWAHLQKVLISACTQSMQLVPPTLHMPIDIQDIALNISTAHYFYGDLSPNSISTSQLSLQTDFTCNLFIGPEGGWSNADLKLLEQCTPIHFPGPILRTETAAIILASTLKSQMNIISRK